MLKACTRTHACSRESFPADPASHDVVRRTDPQRPEGSMHIPPRIPIRPLWSHHLRMCPVGRPSRFSDG